RLPALSGVSLSVEPGELLGVIGPNGSGKTTLFNCVTGVLPPSGGHVLFRGEDITGRTADAVYQRGIARTFQLIQLFPEMTVLENMLVAAQEKTGTLLSRLLRRQETKDPKRPAERKRRKSRAHRTSWCPWPSRGCNPPSPRTCRTVSRTPSTWAWRSCRTPSSSSSTSRWPA